MRADYYNGETFHGFPVKSKVDKAAAGTPRHAELTLAISQWRKAALGTGQNMATCENAARELEIERDSGLVVHINTRV